MAVTVRRASAETAYIRFSLPAEEPPGPVSIVGSFNDWTPGAHEMHEDDDDGGGRSVIIEVPYGDEVHFRYLADGGRWFDDDETPTDSEGGVVVAVESAEFAQRAGDDARPTTDRGEVMSDPGLPDSAPQPPEEQPPLGDPGAVPDPPARPDEGDPATDLSGVPKVSEES